MKRVIVDHTKLTSEILELLGAKFPDGYDFNDILSFQNLKGDWIKAVEVRTEETSYLVKISEEMEDAMEAYLNAINNAEVSKE